MCYAICYVCIAQRFGPQGGRSTHVRCYMRSGCHKTEETQAAYCAMCVPCVCLCARCVPILHTPIGVARVSTDQKQVVSWKSQLCTYWNDKFVYINIVCFDVGCFWLEYEMYAPRDLLRAYAFWDRAIIILYLLLVIDQHVQCVCVCVCVRARACAWVRACMRAGMCM